MGLRFAVKAAVVMAGSVVSFAAVPFAVAHADGRVTWQNDNSKNYLEVYHSSTADGAMVGQWPWNGSATQYWTDITVESGYYKELNYHSGKALDPYNDCSVHQYGYWGGASERWAERHFTSYYGDVKAWRLINKNGCGGDPYTDALHVDTLNNYYQANLMTEVACGTGRWYLESCQWH